MKRASTIFLSAATLVAGLVALAVPQASAVDTTVRCNNGFRHAVPAQAAPGIARAIMAYSAYTQRPVSCFPQAGGTLGGPPTTVGCNNGFRRDNVPAQAARGQATAIEAFSQHTNRPVNCFPN